MTRRAARAIDMSGTPPRRGPAHNPREGDNHVRPPIPERAEAAVPLDEVVVGAARHEDLPTSRLPQAVDHTLAEEAAAAGDHDATSGEIDRHERHSSETRA